ncbi:MAG: HEAT repeat domain-containing protein, partial [Defluviitoga tunisiensis]
MLYSRDEVILKIIEEKGIKAIPNLIELLEDENPEVRELAMEALSILAPEGKDYLLKEFKKRFRMNLQDDVVLLYLAELLSDYRCSEIKEDLETMFNRFSDERAFPLILENLLKVTQDEKYLDLLKTYLDGEDIDVEE